MKNSIIEGLPISAGIAVGPVFALKYAAFEPTGRRIDAAEVEPEMERLEQTYARTRRDVEKLEGTEGARPLTDMLANPLLHGSIVDRIQAGQCAEDAVVRTIHDLLLIYGESPDPFFRDQADHAEAVGRRLFRYLLGLPTPTLTPEQPVVLVTDEMTAFDATRLRADRVAGIITERAGATSHFAIVAKQLGIPAVSGIANVLETFAEARMCICDGDSGRVVLDPDKASLEVVQARLTEQEDQKKDYLHLSGRPTATSDGMPVALWGNIAGPDDVPAILSAGACGVGMFRTEFIFTGDEAPSEERQAYIYGDILRQTPGPVVMRTLEAGGDKVVPYLAGDPEENPNLGWQGLRMCLDMEDLFLTQLKGMLRASTEGELWIMFPFVSALWELRKCRNLVTRARQELTAQGFAIGEYKVGVMIEVPSAALLADAFLRDFDFCSIGTNDLTQFTLAADRMNPKVARWYDPFHPAVLRLIAMSANAARRARKPIGMAGDMASNPLAIPFLLGIGLEMLSATASRIPDVKSTILATDSRWARELAREVLKIEDTEAVREYLQKKQDR